VTPEEEELDSTCSGGWNHVNDLEDNSTLNGNIENHAEDNSTLSDNIENNSTLDDDMDNTKTNAALIQNIIVNIMIFVD